MQGVITEAIAAFTGEHVTLQGAGRTDAGVHALGQVAHVDLAKDWDVDTVRDAINFHLRPRPVAVLVAESVADTFEARFSAIKRHYRYRIINRRPISRLSKIARGACLGRSITQRCIRPRKSSSAGTISPPSVPPNVRPNHR